MQRKVGLISLGCAKNRVDSEQMLGMMGKENYELVNDPSQAEILIVNTCGFIESAKEEAIDTLLEMAQYKKNGTCRLLVATGCLVQRYGPALKEQMPEIDVLLGVGEYPRLLEALEEGLGGNRPLHCGRSQDVFSGPRVLTTPGYSAFVRISDGCDNRCSYCAIPLIRGGYRSRSMESVLSEAELLSSQGVRELTYIAQDTTRFGDDMPPHVGQLPDLIRRTCALEGLEWVRVLYCYPSRVSDALLEALAQEPKACPYLDLPLQHIDANLLRAMNRHGSPEEIRALLRRARSMGLTLRTTFIVGFPGEDEAAFSRLCDFVEEVQFDRMGAFAYSPEEDTPAIRMANTVPEEVKAERLDRLMKIQRRISRARNQLRVGQTVQVLCEGTQGSRYVGRSKLEAPEGDGKILFSADRAVAPGEFVSVRLTRALAYDLEGECI